MSYGANYKGSIKSGAPKHFWHIVNNYLLVFLINTFLAYSKQLTIGFLN